MITVGAFDAKTHLSSLLKKVAKGEEVLITRRGVPVARLVPVEQPDRRDVADAIRELRSIREGVTLGDLDWKELRDEGRP
ncbi:MAG: type II toxin-antitoxin system prevent-host-death family antitoxin [Gemmatimonadetes bacterium]|nr:type II toxin-antitoxin system prevent-host-death family antitoxin [Gemmatimonadota bacterium]MXX71535.1 type II toxin-antitoxin system prevent-host-death family antitoxin [Gemmatimonadota bacterium]MYC91888.1 type II toxin-antitoxin system prevent-host-death family antitoxin [Gemmatimonadota bacterium]MYG35356.1 type II toxin-antitoxin system prevent-host-death family antitoxin [Gemmatimonadota bacterium]MYJ17729.1 type II toxin-antitoxin system prevent-host-death family antitoxin [Gemmatim